MLNPKCGEVESSTDEGLPLTRMGAVLVVCMEAPNMRVGTDDPVWLRSSSSGKSVSHVDMGEGGCVVSLDWGNM